MAGKIIYHGECNNPPHREFVDEYVMPLVREVVGVEPLQIDILIARSGNSDADRDVLIRDMESILEEHFPEVNTSGNSSYIDFQKTGFSLAFINERNDAEWFYIPQNLWITQQGLVKSHLRNTYWEVLNKFVTKLLREFRSQLVSEGV